MTTISQIRRLSDNKVFKCYYRSGISNSIVTTGNTPNVYSWWVDPISGEELCLQGVDTDIYKVIKIEE